jgi:hypothetical protein
VSIPYIVWEKLVRYFEDHQTELVGRGVNSPSRLASMWIEDSYLRAKAIEEGYLKATRNK